MQLIADGAFHQVLDSLHSKTGQESSSSDHSGDCMASLKVTASVYCINSCDLRATNFVDLFRIANTASWVVNWFLLVAKGGDSVPAIVRSMSTNAVLLLHVSLLTQFTQLSLARRRQCSQRW